MRAEGLDSKGSPTGSGVYPYRVRGSGFRVQGSGIRVQGSGFTGPVGFVLLEHAHEVIRNEGLQELELCLI